MTKAFTLAEILVFIALLTIAIFGLMAAQVYALQCTHYNKSRHTASTILESEINHSRAQLIEAFSEDISHSKSPDEYYPDFSTYLECIYHEPSIDENLKKITCTVYWTDRDTKQETHLTGWTYVYRVH